jgi:hypothetical protein
MALFVQPDHKLVEVTEVEERYPALRVRNCMPLHRPVLAR